jgi:multiple sugar transport system ATP-binding protein
MSRVVFDHLTKHFGQVVAVDDFTLEVEDQEFLVLLGPSGCGKTTALRVVAGLEDPTNGRILIGERVMNDVPAKHRDVAMVFQNYALYPHMSVYDNMVFGLRLRHIPQRERDRMVRETAQTLGLEEMLRRKPAELSGGQRQRVALGRAIVRRPSVFLMDEPLSNLDAKLRVQTRSEIIKLHRRLEGTFIYVTHDQVEAMTMGSRIAIMNEGALQQVGPPQEVYDRPANLFVAAFIGSPAMNFFEARLERRGREAVAVAEDAEFPLLPEQVAAVAEHGVDGVVVGVRPEHLDLVTTDADGHLQATVDTVESLGHEQHVTFSQATRSLVARLSPEYRLRVGEQIRLRTSPQHVHLFDPADGRRIEPA